MIQQSKPRSFVNRPNQSLRKAGRGLCRYILQCVRKWHTYKIQIFKPMLKIIPSYKRVKSTFYRCSEVGSITITNPADLTEEYKINAVWKKCLSDSRYYIESWLIYSSEDMLMFSSLTDLKVLFNSSVWIASGTFKVSPPTRH